jgi:hypothetical protein
MIRHDRLFLDRIGADMLVFKGDARVEWFEGIFEDYAADRSAVSARTRWSRSGSGISNLCGDQSARALSADLGLFSIDPVLDAMATRPAGTRFGLARCALPQFLRTGKLFG